MITAIKRFFRRCKLLRRRRVFRRLSYKAQNSRNTQSFVEGPYGNRKVTHFYPDGTRETHEGGGVCMCDVIWILGSIREK